VNIIQESAAMTVCLLLSFHAAVSFKAISVSRAMSHGTSNFYRL